MLIFAKIWKLIAALGRALAAAFGFYPAMPEGVVRLDGRDADGVARRPRDPQKRYCNDMTRPLPPVESLTEPELDAMWAAIERDIAALEAEPATESERWLDAVAAIAVEHSQREPKLWQTLGPVKAMLHAVLAALGLTETQRIVLARLVMRHRRLNREARDIAARGDQKTPPTGRTSV